VLQHLDQNQIERGWVLEPLKILHFDLDLLTIHAREQFLHQKEGYAHRIDVRNVGVIGEMLLAHEETTVLILLQITLVVDFG
jgi:hypothetical protein